MTVWGKRIASCLIYLVARQGDTALVIESISHDGKGGLVFL